MRERGDHADLSLAGATNAEWDFMGRTFLVLALGNLCLRQPDHRARYLAVLDAAIDDTLQVEARSGFTHFLMPYGQVGGWVRQPTASLFVDGEIAAMLATRPLIADHSGLRALLLQRLERVAGQMNAGPIGSAVSYPDECWTFCNSTALAALQMGCAAGVHVAPGLPRRWLRSARAHLIESSTGLLVSSYRLDGQVMDGPEGSSLWMSSPELLTELPNIDAVRPPACPHCEGPSYVSGRIWRHRHGPSWRSLVLPGADLGQCQLITCCAALSLVQRQQDAVLLAVLMRSGT